MKSNDNEFLDALSSAISKIEESKHNLAELKSNNPRDLIIYVLRNWIRELPEDFPLELIGELGVEATDLVNEFKIQCDDFENTQARILAFLDQLLAKAKEAKQQ